jgi:hypothetical protein
VTLDSLLPLYVVFTRGDFENLLDQISEVFTRVFGHPGVPVAGTIVHMMFGASPPIAHWLFPSPITGGLLTEVRLAERW